MHNDCTHPHHRRAQRCRPCKTAREQTERTALVTFWRKVDKSGKCWVWTGGCFRDGYGQFKLNGRTYRAHRLSFEHHISPIPDGLQVLHRCDNPPCVRPSHLFLGTNLDNVRDRIAKGREGDHSGAHNGRAKLTEVQANEIRDRYAAGGVFQYQLAAEYGVSQPAIGFITRGEHWRHLPTPTPKRRQRDAAKK